jgi:hypothetical protein
MESRNREENRADLGRVLLALVVLALLATLDNSHTPAPTVAQVAAEASR